MGLDFSAMDRFLDKVEDKTKAAASYAADGVVEALEKNVKQYYPSSVINYEVNYETPKHNVTVVSVNDDNLWFKEFGTGLVGLNNGYINELPSTPLIFASRGDVHHTAGWEYMYHPKTRLQGGWTYYRPGVGFRWTRGQPAFMGVAMSTRDLKVHGVPHLADYIAIKLKG